jgi:hypothetical protein
MKRSTKGLIAAAGFGVGLGAVNPSVAYTQEPTILPNRISSLNSNFSVSGESLILNDLVHDLEIDPASRIHLYDAFGLYALRGDVHYEVMGKKEGLEYIEQRLGKDNLTEREEISLGYFRSILEGAEIDSASVKKVRRSVEDKVVDAKEDSLFIDGVPQFVDRKYFVVVSSESTGEYLGQSFPFMINLSSTSNEPLAEAQEQAVEAAQDTSRGSFRDFIYRMTHPDTTKKAEGQLIFPWLRQTPQDTLGTEAQQAVVDTILAEREDTAADSLGSLRRDARRSRYDGAITNPSAGLSFEVGSGHYPVVGAFGELPIMKGLSLTADGRYYVSPRGSALNESVTETGLEEREFLAPKVYNTKKDTRTIDSDNDVVADFTAGIMARLQRNLEVYFNFGPAVLRREQEETLRRRLGIEVNGVEEQTKTIENTRGLPREYRIDRSIRAGLRANVHRNADLGIAFYDVGGNRGINVEGRIRFRK